jgi:hypothetical protein
MDLYVLTSQFTYHTAYVFFIFFHRVSNREPTHLKNVSFKYLIRIDHNIYKLHGFYNNKQ